MKPDDLAAAVERLLSAMWIRSQHADAWSLRDVTALVKHIAAAYLAREAAIATCEQTCDAATTDRITRMIAGKALFDVYPPPNDLDQRWREQWSQARYLEDLEDFAETQIAREADDAKPLTLDVLRRELGEPVDENYSRAYWCVGDDTRVEWKKWHSPASCCVGSSLYVRTLGQLCRILSVIEETTPGGGDAAK